MEFKSPGAVDRMQAQAQRWRDANDTRYLFLSCYAMMTGNVLCAIDEGRFQDGPWVERLLLRFADYYFDALNLCEHHSAQTPRVWAWTFHHTQAEKIHVLQYMLIGVNAHINYDLVLTLHELLRPEWEKLDEKQKDIRQADHLLINEIIGETIDVVQDEIIEQYSSLMAIVDRILGRVDEWILSELIRAWRAEVWMEVQNFLAVTDPEELEIRRRQLEERVIRRGEQILGMV